MPKRVFHSVAVHDYTEGDLSFVGVGFGFVEEPADEEAPKPTEPRWTLGMNLAPGGDVEYVASTLEAFARVLRLRYATEPDVPADDAEQEG